VFTSFIKKYLTTKNILLVTFFLSFFLLVRWNLITAPFERDEGNYAYSAWLIRKGIMPYENTFPNKPPMIIYTYLASQIFFGDHIWSPRVLMVISSLIVIFVLGLIVKMEYGSFAAWLSAFLLSLMLILPGGYGGNFLADIYYAANTEIFMILPLVVLLYLFRRYREKAGLKIWFLAGVMSSLALNYKPICLLIIVYIFVCWILDSWKQQKSISYLSKNIMAAFVGLLFSSVIIYLPFLVSDGGRKVFDQLINYTGCYVKSNDWLITFDRLISRIIILLKYYWFLYVLFIYFLIKKPKHWLFYLGLFLISYFSVAPSIIGHFFIQTIPFFLIIIVISVGEIRKEKIFKGKGGLLVVAVFITILWPLRQMFTKSPQEIGLWVYGPYDQYYEAEFIGKKISEITKPDDFVFNEGDDGEIIYFSQRRSAVRLEFTGSLISDCKMLKNYQADYYNDIKSNNPQVIVLCLRGSCGYVWNNEKIRPFTDYLIGIINEGYRVVGGWIPNNEGGYWLEPIKTEDIPYARTVIFKKK